MCTTVQVLCIPYLQAVTIATKPSEDSFNITPTLPSRLWMDYIHVDIEYQIHAHNTIRECLFWYFISKHSNKGKLVVGLATTICVSLWSTLLTTVSTKHNFELYLQNLVLWLTINNEDHFTFCGRLIEQPQPTTKYKLTVNIQYSKPTYSLL